MSRAQRVSVPLTAIAVATLTVLALLTWGSASSGPATDSRLALAADTSQFQAGNIISDDLFFDGRAMSAADVQAFVTTKGASCSLGADTSPCLKDYVQDTSTRPADALCAQYTGAPGERASTIIAKVGAACGISQRVLLVILQKEEGLVRTTNPSATKYRTAMGFGCPDTAACDSQYYGFFNQVYSAAHQYRKYAANPTNYNYRPGVTRSVLFNPNAACGSSQVYIADQATAGLYNYTPYQPNAAALAAGYGTGNSCSAYGNRNFWEYYTDWFGSTQSPGGNAVVSRAQAPATTAVLGSATSNVVCGLPNAGGCFQHFQLGSIYWSPATGAQLVKGAIRDHWAATGWEAGPLGYPTGEEICGLRDSGCFERFQGGSVYWDPAVSAHHVSGPIQTAWAAQKWETGPLGYPTRDAVCGLRDGGCFQNFEGGKEYWSPATGAHAVSGDLLTAWAAQKWETGPLGYPTAEATCGLADSGCVQTFQGGTLATNAVTGAHVLTGAVLSTWTGTGRATGPLGWPTGNTVCGLVDGGCFAHFQNGSAYTSTASGPHLVTAAVQDKWASLAWELGPLGYPTSNTFCGLVGGGCFNAFQHGSVYWTQNTGAVSVSGVVRDRWQSLGWEAGSLGYPVRDQVCGLVASGCFQDFQHGSVYSAPATGTWSVSEPVLNEWGTQGWEHGWLGYPTANTFCGLVGGGCYSPFQGGSVYWTAAQGAHFVRGAIGTAWGAQGWERGPLGYPTSDETCNPPTGGCHQDFVGGSISWSRATGARVVLAPIAAAWTAAGAEGGLGFPTRDRFCGLVRGGCFQDFQDGSVYTSPAGTFAVSGAIRTAWGAQGWENGSLGYPAADAVSTSTTRTQRFEGGTLVQDLATGMVTRQ